MAEKVKFIIDIDDNGSSKVIDGFNDKLKDTKKSSKQAEDSIDNTLNAAKGGANIFKTLGAAIKGAFAMTGIMKVLDMFVTLLMENEKVAELFRKGMVLIQGVFNGLMEVIEPLFPILDKIFKDPMQSLKDFGNMLKENILNRFYGLLELIPNLGKAIGLLFKGEFAEAGKVAANAFGKIALGLEDTIGTFEKVGEFVVDASKKISKATKKAWDNKDLLANAEQNIEKLSILYQGIVEKYDLMAEKQRQIRDDETKTIAERMKANEELAKVLDEGAKKEKANINARIGILQTQNKLLGNNKDRQNEILSLTQELTAVDAKYAGLKSEQLTNINALSKEAVDLKKSEVEGTIEANKIIAQANIDRMADDLEKFDARKKMLDDEYNQKLDLANSEIAKYAEGTQAYIDAVNEKKILDAQYSADSMALMDERIKFIGEAADQELEITRNLEQAKVEAVLGAMQGVQQLLGEDSKYGKALAIAQAVISTYQGAAKALGQGGIVGPIAAAGVVASGLAQVRAIMQTELPESSIGGGGGGGGGTASVAMPSVGIVSGQINQTNQLQAQLNSQMSKPTRAYVVGQNVTSQQSLDRHIAENATL